MAQTMAYITLPTIKNMPFLRLKLVATLQLHLCSLIIQIEGNQLHTQISCLILIMKFIKFLPMATETIGKETLKCMRHGNVKSGIKNIDAKTGDLEN